jgi:hypothetical protein
MSRVRVRTALATAALLLAVTALCRTSCMLVDAHAAAPPPPCHASGPAAPAAGDVDDCCAKLLGMASPLAGLGDGPAVAVGVIPAMPHGAPHGAPGLLRRATGAGPPGRAAPLYLLDHALLI